MKVCILNNISTVSCTIDYTKFVVSGKLERLKLAQPHQLVTVATPTDRLKSVQNRCVIDVFGGVFVLLRCFLDFSVGVGAFVIGLSQISSFFSVGV